MPQGTIKSWDRETHESVVITDDLVEHPVPARTFQDSTLIELRIGQRVRFEFVDDGDGGQYVAHLGIVSL